jgi:hypothetical protein
VIPPDRCLFSRVLLVVAVVGGVSNRGILAFDFACCNISVIFEAHVRKRPTLFTGASGTSCRLFDFPLMQFCSLSGSHTDTTSLCDLSHFFRSLFFCSSYFSFPPSFSLPPLCLFFFLHGSTQMPTRTFLSRRAPTQ